MKRQKRRFLAVDNDNLGTPGEGTGTAPAADMASLVINPVEWPEI